jgi:hypothetical protein
MTVEELGVDAAVELVQVHGVNPLLDALVLAVKLHERLVMELLLVRLTLPQSSRPGRRSLKAARFFRPRPAVPGDSPLLRQR